MAVACLLRAPPSASCRTCRDGSEISGEARCLPVTLLWSRSTGVIFWFTRNRAAASHRAHPFSSDQSQAGLEFLSPDRRRRNLRFASSRGGLDSRSSTATTRGRAIWDQDLTLQSLCVRDLGERLTPELIGFHYLLECQKRKLRSKRDCCCWKSLRCSIGYPRY